MVGGYMFYWNIVSLGIVVMGNFQCGFFNSVVLGVLQGLLVCLVENYKLMLDYKLYGYCDVGYINCLGNSFYDVIKIWFYYDIGKLVLLIKMFICF